MQKITASLSFRIYTMQYGYKTKDYTVKYFEISVDIFFQETKVKMLICFTSDIYFKSTFYNYGSTKKTPLH